MQEPVNTAMLGLGLKYKTQFGNCCRCRFGYTNTLSAGIICLSWRPARTWNYCGRSIFRCSNRRVRPDCELACYRRHRPRLPRHHFRSRAYWSLKHIRTWAKSRSRYGRSSANF